jgi:hypothetical protein
MTEWVLEATGLGRDFRQGPTTLTVLRDLEGADRAWRARRDRR